MQVFVTPNAEEDFDSIVQHIRKQWGERTAKQFLTKAEKVFNLLQNFPAMDRLKTAKSEVFNCRLKRGFFIESQITESSYFPSLTQDRIQRREWSSTYALQQ